ncbi:MAG: hypothetical protein JWR77_418 [Rhizorhabdus sp.]|nr:hypothetical protein [Rhizorhabdus sp.]
MMVFRKLGAMVAALSVIGAASPASAYLFWFTPNFAGAPVRGDEPGIGLPMPKATPAELQAHLLWNMRAGLNVAALQCQFSPMLQTVANYNDLLSKNSAELNSAYQALNGYFKRTGGKSWAGQFDQYTTRTYNGFSTMHAQLGFCETASAIGREARKLGRGGLGKLAVSRMREFRNSLIPVGDMLFARRPLYTSIPTPPLNDDCWTKKDGMLKARCVAGSPVQASAEASARVG